MPDISRNANKHDAFKKASREGQEQGLVQGAGFEGFSENAIGGAKEGIFQETQIPFVFTLQDRNGNTMLQTGGKPVPKLIFQSDTGSYNNPTSKESPYKKIVSRETTRGGWVEYHGGDELDSMSFNGTTGAFYDPEKGLVNISEGRFNTSQRQFIENLLGIYRNNGIYTDGRGITKKTGDVLLIYDYGTYWGFFETLTLTESADKPYSMTYSFTFTVDKAIIQIPNAISKNYYKGDK